MEKKSSSKYLFLRPPLIGFDAGFEPCFESLGLEYIVAFCRKQGHDCMYIDANLQKLTVEDTCSIIKQAHPKFIGITISADRILSSTKAIIDFCGNLIPKPLICVGGHFVSYDLLKY